MSPIPVVSDVFGPLVGPTTIEKAAVATLTKWLNYTYLQEVERQNGLLPNTILHPESIHGAGDETDYAGESMPEVIAICTRPDGEPEYYESEGYTQMYELTCGVVVENVDEDVARDWAGLYATAMMGVIVQQFASDHPNLVANLRMTASPEALLQNAEQRILYTGQVSFNVWVAPISVATDGPLVPIPDQGVIPPWSTIATEDLTVTAEPPSL